MHKLQYFGPKQHKRQPRLVCFGAILKCEGIWYTCHYQNGTYLTSSYVSPANLWDALTDSETPQTWYAHDVNTLLNHLILEILPPEELEKKVITKSGKEIDKMLIIPKGESDSLKLVIRQAKKRQKSCSLRDVSIINTQNFFDSSPEELVKCFGTGGWSNPQELAKAVYLALAYIHIWIIEKLHITPSVTFSSSVVKALQVGFIKDLIPKLPKEVGNFIAPAIAGGRTELYRMWQEDAKFYDKNGLYGEAYSMPLPVKLPYTRDNLTPEQLLNIKDPGFVDVDIYVPEELDKGPLPVHDGQRGTIYPVGYIHSTKRRPVRYFTPLLEEAVSKHGVVIEKVNFGIFFKKSLQFLRPWAEFTASLKEKAKNKGEKELATLAMQVVYGKFAQKEERQVVHIGTIPKDRREDPTVTFLDIDLPIWYETVERLLANHLPHIAAAITGWAHLIMLRDFERVTAHGGQVCYTDTDSLVTDKYLPKDMVGTSLGTYRLEYDNDTFFGAAPKFYFRIPKKAEEKIEGKIKGIPNYQATRKDIEALLGGKKLQFEWEKSPTIVETIVSKYLYESNPIAYENVIASLRQKEKRSLPGNARRSETILDIDSRRHQLSLTESRPLNMSELPK